MKKTISFLCILFSLTFLSLNVSAQVTTSSMSGKITDENGPLAGASIVATHVPSGTVYYSAADNSGNFRIPNIQAGGPYSVKITMLGFRDYEVTDINVALGDNYVLKVLMQEETVSLNAIVVSAESSSSSMRSDRAGAVTSVGVREISDIPTVSRSVNDILKLTPQASSSGKEIGGGNYRQSFVTVDGAAFNNAFGIGQNIPANGSPISIDAVEQISVNIAPYDVRQSGFIGASINAITRSGSNRFEGSAYTYFNNQDMKGVRIGKDYTLTRSDSQYLMYGGRVGGPIIKDKLFFFLNVEIEKSVEPGPSRVPSGYDGKVYSDGSDGVARPTQAILDKGFKLSEKQLQLRPRCIHGIFRRFPRIQDPRKDRLEHKPRQQAQRTLQQYQEQISERPFHFDQRPCRQGFHYEQPHVDDGGLFPERTLLPGAELLVDGG
jgi:hypothetical protein